MSPEEVHAYVVSLAGCRRKGTERQPAWYVRDRLVARLTDPATLLVRVPLHAREAFLDDHPQGFGVPPSMEKHHKLEAYLDEAADDAVRSAIRLAWEFQRSW